MPITPPVYRPNRQSNAIQTKTNPHGRQPTAPRAFQMAAIRGSATVVLQAAEAKPRSIGAWGGGPPVGLGVSRPSSGDGNGDDGFEQVGIAGLTVREMRAGNRKSALNFQALGLASADVPNPLFNYHVFRE